MRIEITILFGIVGVMLISGCSTTGDYTSNDICDVEQEAKLSAKEGVEFCDTHPGEIFYDDICGTPVKVQCQDYYIDRTQEEQVQNLDIKQITEPIAKNGFKLKVNIEPNYYDILTAFDTVEKQCENNQGPPGVDCKDFRSRLWKLTWSWGDYDYNQTEEDLFFEEYKDYAELFTKVSCSVERVGKSSIPYSVGECHGIPDIGIFDPEEKIMYTEKQSPYGCLYGDKLSWMNSAYLDNSITIIDHPLWVVCSMTIDLNMCTELAPCKEFSSDTKEIDPESETKYVWVFEPKDIQ